MTAIIPACAELRPRSKPHKRPNAIGQSRAADQIPDAIHKMDSAEENEPVIGVDKRPDRLRVLSTHEVEFWPKGLEKASTIIAVAPRCIGTKMIAKERDSRVELVFGDLDVFVRHE